MRFHQELYAYPSTTLKISYTPYLRIQLPGAVCGGRTRTQILSELYAEAGYTAELYAYGAVCVPT